MTMFSSVRVTYLESSSKLQPTHRNNVARILLIDFFPSLVLLVARVMFLTLWIKVFRSSIAE